MLLSLCPDATKQFWTIKTVLLHPLSQHLNPMSTFPRLLLTHYRSLTARLSGRALLSLMAESLAMLRMILSHLLFLGLVSVRLSASVCPASAAVHDGHGLVATVGDHLQAGHIDADRAAKANIEASAKWVNDKTGMQVYTANNINDLDDGKSAWMAHGADRTAQQAEYNSIAYAQGLIEARNGLIFSLVADGAGRVVGKALGPLWNRIMAAAGDSAEAGSPSVNVPRFGVKGGGGAAPALGVDSNFTPAEQEALKAADELGGLRGGQERLGIIADALKRRGYPPEKIVEMLKPLEGGTGIGVPMP